MTLSKEGGQRWGEQAEVGREGRGGAEKGEQEEGGGERTEIERGRQGTSTYMYTGCVPHCNSAQLLARLTGHPTA